MYIGDEMTWLLSILQLPMTKDVIRFVSPNPYAAGDLSSPNKSVFAWRQTPGAIFLALLNNNRSGGTSAGHPVHLPSASTFGKIPPKMVFLPLDVLQTFQVLQVWEIFLDAHDFLGEKLKLEPPNLWGEKLIQ